MSLSPIEVMAVIWKSQWPFTSRCSCTGRLSACTRRIPCISAPCEARLAEEQRLVMKQITKLDGYSR